MILIKTQKIKIIIKKMIERKNRKKIKIMMKMKKLKKKTLKKIKIIITKKMI